MSYKQEYAKHYPNQNIMASELPPIFQNIEITTFESKYERIDSYIASNGQNLKKINLDDNKLKYIFVIDGSTFESDDFDNSFAKLGLFNINQCVVDVNSMIGYLKEKFPPPQQYNKIKKDLPTSIILPLGGIKRSDYPDESDFFRYSLFDFFQNLKNPFVMWLEENHYQAQNKETLLETYKKLVSNIAKITPIAHPCKECKKNGKNLSLKYFKEDDKIKDIIKCHCEVDPKDIYLTDLLGFYEQFNVSFEAIGESSSGLSTQIMLVLEKLVTLNTINLINTNQLQNLLEESAFILDGTLAIYSSACWLSEAINRELIEIKDHNPLLLISIEKTGKFVESFKKIDNFFNKKNEPLKNQMLYFLTDEYIEKYIKINDGGNFYGQKTYFGKKAFYKNKLGKLFVVNIAFEDEADKYVDYNNRNNIDLINKVTRLSDIITILDNFSSQSYENALSLISMAHEGAALSASSMGRKLLNEYLKGAFNLNKE